MQRWTIRLMVGAALTWIGVAVIHAEDPVVPVYHEPHHRQTFQYGPTRLIDLQIPPGDTSWFHSHESPILYVTFSTSQTKTQNLGEEWGTRGAGPGRGAGRGAEGAPERPPSAGPPVPAVLPRISSTTSYAERPVTHRLQNIGERLFRAVGVINETAGDESMTEQAAGFDAKPELANRWFRAYRTTLGPGESTPSHRHKTTTVVFQASEGHGLAAGAMKFELNEPGQWAFFVASDSHTIRNTGSSRLEFVEVEVRQP
jgi:mannose-6-phosphate isomerase-like protein (cupin superfamily)